MGFNRGIPSGYISSLEERLIETEIALFEALSFINIHFHQDRDIQPKSSDHRDAFIEYSMGLSKQAKVEEWKCIPLTFEDQRKTWLQEKLHVVNGRSNDSIGESLISHQTENQRLGSSLPLFSPYNDTQPTLQGQPLTHNQNVPNNQDIALSRYQPTMHGDKSLQVYPNHSSSTIETPKRLPGMNTWANKSEEQLVTKGVQVFTREIESRVHDSYDVAANSDGLEDRQQLPELHTAIERAPMGEEVSLSPQGRQGSISSGFSRRSTEASRVSLKQWQRYF